MCIARKHFTDTTLFSQISRTPLAACETHHSPPEQVDSMPTNEVAERASRILNPNSAAVMIDPLLGAHLLKQLTTYQRQVAILLVFLACRDPLKGGAD